MELNLKLEKEELLKQVKEYDERITELINEQNELSKIRYNGFVKYYQSLKPVIDYMKANHYYFSHENVKVISKRGPIIGKGEYGNTIYCLDFPIVTEVKLGSDNEGKKEHLERFLQHSDFDFAMNGLIAVKDVYKNTERDSIENIENLKKQIGKYGFSVK